jgi:hypothetical protein
MNLENTYFIHGFKTWERNGYFKLRGEISISLHKEGHTKPLRDFGFILSIDLEHIIAAFDCDITSKVENGKRVLSWQSKRGAKNYDKTNLDQLIKNTPKGKHNELWVCGENVEIIGGYYIGSGHESFIKSMTHKKLQCLNFGI